MLGGNMMQTKLLAGVALVLMVGCGSSQKSSDIVEPGEKEPPVWAGTADVDDEEIDDGSLKFDEEAAKVVLKRGGRKAQNCPNVVPDTPLEESDIDVVFDGTKGRVVDVDLSTSSFSGASEQAQKCIKNSFIGEILPPFDGKKVMPFTLKIEKTDAKK
jgi:hypothetical protein